MFQNKNLLLFLLISPLWVATLFCSNTPPPPTRTPVPVTANTLPPVWTPTTSYGGTAIPGWQQFNGRGMILWLPEHFVGGNPLTLGDEFSDVFGLTSSQEDDIQQILGDLPREIVFVAVDDLEDFYSMVVVLRVNLPGDITLEEIMEIVTSPDTLAGSNLQLLDSGTLTIQDRQVGRRLAHAGAGEVFANEVGYFIQKDDNTFWGIYYAIVGEDIDVHLPTFDESIRTFTFAGP